MQRIHFLVFATLLVPFVAACAPDPAANSGNAGDSNVDAVASANPPAEAPPPAADPGEDNAELPLNEAEDDSEESPSTAVIPGQYHGRWGRTASDCTAPRGFGEGLMTISDDTIRLYESRAVLQERRPAIANSFSGTFIFTGEGETWERVITLTRTGDMLKRAQADGSWTYRRCA